MARRKSVTTKPRLTVLFVSAVFILLGAVAQAQPAAEEAPFYDVPSTHWAYGAVRQLTELGVMTGYPDGRFDGTRTASRYELAVVAARLLEAANSQTTQNSGEVTSSDEALEATPLATRVQALEDALARAASLAYTQRLEARVVALEAALNTRQGEGQGEGQGEDTFPAEADTGSQTVAPSPLTTEEPAAEPNIAGTNTAADVGTGLGTRLGEVRFSSRPAYPLFVGISPGVVSTAGDVYLSVQVGYDALLGPVGPVARLTFNGGNRELRFSVDALAKADVLSDTLKVYGGLGFGVTDQAGGGTTLLEAPFGGEVFITPRLGLFLQLTTSYGFAPVNEVDAELSTGINLRF